MRWYRFVSQMFEIHWCVCVRFSFLCFVLTFILESSTHKSKKIQREKHVSANNNNFVATARIEIIYVTFLRYQNRARFYISMPFYCVCFLMPPEKKRRIKLCMSYEYAKMMPQHNFDYECEANILIASKPFWITSLLVAVHR